MVIIIGFNWITKLNRFCRTPFFHQNREISFWRSPILLLISNQLQVNNLISFFTLDYFPQRVATEQQRRFEGWMNQLVNWTIYYPFRGIFHRDISQSIMIRQLEKWPCIHKTSKKCPLMHITNWQDGQAQMFKDFCRD